MRVTPQCVKVLVNSDKLYRFKKDTDGSLSHMDAVDIPYDVGGGDVSCATGDPTGNYVVGIVLSVKCTT